MSQEKARSLGIAIAKWTKNRNSAVIRTAMPFLVTVIGFSTKAMSAATWFIVELYKDVPTKIFINETDSTYSHNTPICCRIAEEARHPNEIIL